MPAIFLFNLDKEGGLEFSRTIDLVGNPFDIGIVDGQTLIVAVDPSHEEAEPFDLSKSLLRIRQVDGEYRVSEDVIQDNADLEADASSEDDISGMERNKMLYSAEMLRKTNFEDRDAAEETKVEQEG